MVKLNCSFVLVSHVLRGSNQGSIKIALKLVSQQPFSYSDIFLIQCFITKPHNLVLVRSRRITVTHTFCLTGIDVNFNNNSSKLYLGAQPF